MAGLKLIKSVMDSNTRDKRLFRHPLYDVNYSRHWNVDNLLSRSVRQQVKDIGIAVNLGGAQLKGHSDRCVLPLFPSAILFQIPTRFRILFMFQQIKLIDIIRSNLPQFILFQLDKRKSTFFRLF